MEMDREVRRFTGEQSDELLAIQRLTEHHVDIANLKQDLHEIRNDVAAIRSEFRADVAAIKDMITVMLTRMSEKDGQMSGGWKIFLLACGALGFLITAGLSIITVLK